MKKVLIGAALALSFLASVHFGRGMVEMPGQAMADCPDWYPSCPGGY